MWSGQITGSGLALLHHEILFFEWSEGRTLDEVPACQRRQLPKTLDFYKESLISKNDAIAKAFKSGGYTMKEVAGYFGVHYSTVSRVVRKSDE